MNKEKIVYKGYTIGGVSMDIGADNQFAISATGNIGDIVDHRNVVQFRQHKLSINTRRVSKPASNMTVRFQIVHILMTLVLTNGSSKHSIEDRNLQ